MLGYFAAWSQTLKTEDCKLCLARPPITGNSTHFLVSKTSSANPACMIVPFRHVETPFDFTEGEWADLGPLVKEAKQIGKGLSEARTDALLPQPETGKISCVHHLPYARLTPGIRTEMTCCDDGCSIHSLLDFHQQYSCSVDVAYLQMDSSACPYRFDVSFGVDRQKHGFKRA